MCCCLSYKDTILKANHSVEKIQKILPELLLILQRYYFESESQLDPKYSFQFLAVAYPTKILFWKRITAISEFHLYANVLLLILQRYYFESESQPFLQLHFLDHRCCLSYKDTILKANHSYPAVCKVRSYAVAYPTKILFWKRITAITGISMEPIMLLLILQRYYFESESQHNTLHSNSGNSCCLSYKDTILKANHSSLL